MPLGFLRCILSFCAILCSMPVMGMPSGADEVLPGYRGALIWLPAVLCLLLAFCVGRLLLRLRRIRRDAACRERERGKLLEDLTSYVEQEKLLNNVWERLMIKLDDREVFTEILKTIVGFMGAYTSYIYRSDFSVGKDIVYAHFQADDTPVVPLEEYPQMPINPDAVWFQMTRNHQIWEVTDTETEEARRIQGEWNSHMPALNVRALSGIGLWLNGEYWGYMGFAFRTPQKPLSARQRFLLASMAHIAEIFLERRQNRKDLDRSEYEKHLILDSMHIPILLFNPDMELIRCNNAALKVAGMSEAEVCRIGCRRAFCGDECRSSECPVAQVHGDRKEHICELHVKGRDYQLRAYPIIIDGKLIYIMKTMIDVTEFNAIRRELTTALRTAQEANRAKSSFLATMSHEIRTPLNAVIGFSELLQTGELSKAEQVEYLAAINLSGNSLLNLINDVLDLSRLEAEQEVIAPEPTDVERLLQEIRAVFQYKVQQKGLYFRIDCPGGIPVLRLDRLRLRQILLNLAGNAVKFTEHGGVTCSVLFRRGGSGGLLSVSVRDTGIGIQEEVQQKIFEPFVQGDTVRDTHVYQGTGLGLAISRRLAERMGGAIRLESEPGGGSSFTLELADVELAEPAAEDGEKAAEDAVPGIPKRRVLLVDDVPMNLKVLQAMLRKLGLESRCAASGQEALELLRREPGFGLVLTDLWMPEMDGAELAEKIHEDPATAQLPVAVITADTLNYEKPMDGFQSVLHKPVTMEKLTEFFNSLYPEKCDPGKGGEAI
ncbi:MAG: response regulator [Lentisphaeria bacterium]|nr:response regulator [Lentisphaeria bacterium]